ncbi:MAG: 3-beta hydroxysteroid dehydrogenase [Paracoccus denitrificans]|nr:MAG: 3-beta hydroxysteroid dehydrogenase [Paracoccus denitrificans]PZO84447.1 MAG: 3-beta hydroxysteroid dehydrogenase [Paracoccus denitrificans]
MAKAALIGASGNAGSRILKELSARGHDVTAIARSPEKIAQLPGVTAVAGDVSDETALVDLLKGHDVVISAVHFTASDPDKLIGAVKASGVPRYLVVGGAASLLVEGKPLIDSPTFPDAYKPEAKGGIVFLDKLRATDGFDWVFLSPSAEFTAGERTGKFRLGKDDLLSTDKGSSISFEDFAIALVDELEKPAHHRERFTVGY